MGAYRRILCVTDFSAASIAALRQADDLANELGAKLMILHVVPDPLHQPWSAEAYGLNLADLEAEWINRATADLSRLARTCKSNPVTACRLGKPATEILDYAHTESADLIVAGSHGHGPFANMILGSVADRLVRQARCPVLTVRTTQIGDLATAEAIQAEPAVAAAEPPRA